MAVVDDKALFADANSLNFIGANLINLAPYAPIFDAVLLKDISALNDNYYAVFATAKGLVFCNNKKILEPPQALPNGDIPVKLAYLSPRAGGFAAVGEALNDCGMLYVLAGNQATGKVHVYRYAMSFDAAPVLVDANLTLSAFDLQTFRRTFGTDGEQFIFGHDASLDVNDIIVSSLQGTPTKLMSLTGYLGNNAGLGSFVQSPIKNSVTGTWIIPGSFGILAHD